MSWTDVPMLELLWLALAGVALFVALRAVRWVLSVAPMKRSRVEAVERAWPFVAGAAAVAYLIFAVSTLFGDVPGYGPLAVAVVLGGLFAVVFPALRDLVSGAILRAGRACRVGDHVRVEGIEGRVTRLGYRVMVVQTRAGDDAIVPYSRVSASSVLRRPVLDHVAPRELTVPLPAGRSLAEARTQIRSAAMLAHWSSVTREPEVTLSEPDTLQVTVFALDDDYGPDVEQAVRAALTRTGKP